MFFDYFILNKIIIHTSEYIKKFERELEIVIDTLIERKEKNDSNKENIIIDVKF